AGNGERLLYPGANALSPSGPLPALRPSDRAPRLTPAGACLAIPGRPAWGWPGGPQRAADEPHGRIRGRDGRPHWSDMKGPGVVRAGASGKRSLQTALAPSSPTWWLKRSTPLLVRGGRSNPSAPPPPLPA